MNQTKITATDIAKKLNISRITVDRVLNNRGMVSEETKERVLEMVKTLGYRPNRAAKHLAKKTQCVIGVSYVFPDWFKVQIDQGIQRAFSELSDFGAEVICLNAPHSAQGQMDQIRQILPKIDALAIDPWLPAQLSSFIDELVDGGLPVATFNIDVPSSKRLFYVGCNYFQSGRLCGELITKFAQIPGKVGIITTPENLTHLEQRIMGFREVLSGVSDLKIIGPLKISETDERESIDLIKRFISENPELVALFHDCTNLSLTGAALKETGYAGKIKLVGLDMNEVHRQLIEEDVVQAVVCQEPYYQGYLPFKMLFNYVAEGEWPDKTEVSTRLEIVMRENIQYYHNNQPIL